MGQMSTTNVKSHLRHRLTKAASELELHYFPLRMLATYAVKETVYNRDWCFLLQSIYAFWHILVYSVLPVLHKPADHTSTLPDCIQSNLGISNSDISNSAKL